MPSMNSLDTCISSTLRLIACALVLAACGDDTPNGPQPNQGEIDADASYDAPDLGTSDVTQHDVRDATDEGEVDAGREGGAAGPDGGDSAGPEARDAGQDAGDAGADAGDAARSETGDGGPDAGDATVTQARDSGADAGDVGADAAEGGGLEAGFDGSSTQVLELIGLTAWWGAIEADAKATGNLRETGGRWCGATLSLESSCAKRLLGSGCLETPSSCAIYSDPLKGAFAAGNDPHLAARVVRTLNASGLEPMTATPGEPSTSCMRSPIAERAALLP